MTFQAKRDISKKLRVLTHGIKSGNISKTCRYFGVSRETYYKWKRAYESEGERGLISSKPCPRYPKIRIPKHGENKILYVRRTYHFGQQRSAWYLQRYHKIKVSEDGIRGVLLRHSMSRRPNALFSRFKNLGQMKRQLFVKILKWLQGTVSSFIVMIARVCGHPQQVTF